MSDVNNISDEIGLRKSVVLRKVLRDGIKEFK